MQEKIIVFPEPSPGNREHRAIHNLPPSFTPLIGREQEVLAACALLRRPEVRLLTLVGTGGVGKTRLGLAVAQVLLDDFADGVSFVSLATVSVPALVLAAIAQALDLWDVGDLPLEEQVRAVLSDRHLLLLLDNFEHLLEAAPQLLALLASCPHLSMLVTSRAALHLSGEQEFPVPPLALPDLAHLPEPQTLAQRASVRLFVLRAQAVQPAFELTEANARTIADICVRLDGLPLAIELAAARSKLLPPQALLKRLEHRLSVLTGGCTLEAAEVVCQQDSNQSSRVLEGVASLLDKSLLQQTAREGEEPRLIMLETIREFGLEQLHQQRELEAARQAHARYYLRLSETAGPHLLGPDQLLWLARLEQDLDNLRAILQAAAPGKAEEVELALRLAGALRLFWTSQGYLREGRDVLERLLADTSRAIATPIRLKALNALGVILWAQNDAHRLAQVADEALALAREQGDRVPLTIAMMQRGTAMMLGRGDYTAAQACLEEALDEARALGDLFTLVSALMSLGRLAEYQQDSRRAVPWFEEGVALCRAVGAKGLMATVQILFAQTELSLGHAARAQTLLEESLGIYQEFGNIPAIALIFNMLGRLALQQGELRQAEEFLTESDRLAREVGDQHNLALRSRLLLAGMAALQGDYATARLRYEEGLATTLALGHMSLIASGLKGLGCVAAAQGLHTRAAVLWGTAEPLRKRSMTAWWS
jgi:predicted ATPase